MRHLNTYCRIGLMILVGLGLTSVASARWPVGAGGDQDDDSRRVIVAPSGAVYEAGVFRGVAHFDGTDVSSEGSSDVYIARYSDSGLIEWVATAGGASLDLLADIVLDDAENVYVIGDFYGTIRFSAGGTGGGVGTLSLDAEDAYSDVFVARLGSDGRRHRSAPRSRVDLHRRRLYLRFRAFRRVRSGRGRSPRRYQLLRRFRPGRPVRRPDRH